MHAVLSPQSFSRDALAAFLLLLAVYLLTFSGHLYSPDEEAMYYVARGLASGAGVAVPGGDVVPMPLRPGPDGRDYSPYGLLPSLLALPFYGLGALAAWSGAPPLHDYLTRFGVSMLNAVVTALTGALLLLFVRRLGYGRRAAWLAAPAFGLCTFAWPYARTFFSEPLTGLLLLAAVERILAFRRHGSRSVLLVAGLAAGFALTTRIAEAIALPVLALYLLAPPLEARKLQHEIQPRNFPARLKPIATRLIVFGLGLAPGIALLAAYNLARFGTVFASGYAGEAGAFTTPLGHGLYGLLLSPGKSLWLYAPPALLGLPGALLLWRHRRAETLVLGALVVAHVLLYAKWHAWEGGGVWGPRLLLPIVPLLLALAAPLMDERRKTKDESKKSLPSSFVLRLSSALSHSVLSPQSSVLIWPLLTLGLINALAGVLVNPGVYVNSGVSASRRYYAPADSPLLAHWRILAERTSAQVGGDRCVLGAGFYPSEARSAPLPRYAGPRATFVCNGDGPILVWLSVNDYRPPGAPPSELALTIGGAHAPLPQGHSSQIQLLLPPGAPVTLMNTSWDATATGSPRAISAGALVYGLRATDRAGRVLPLVDASVEPPPASPRLRWGWYFVPFNYHLVDLWPWYLMHSEVEPARQLALAFGVLVIGGAALVGGVMMVRRGRWTMDDGR